MKRLLAIALLSTLSASAEEGLRSGHATAEWLVSRSIKPGATLKTVVRLRVDPHWHVYWHNPGDNGMPTSAELKLPEGWKSSGLQHPVPKKFKTGGLHGFGHEGVVDYPLELSVPQNFMEQFRKGVELEAAVSWLTCNDESCVPGEMTLKLKFADGAKHGAKADPEAVDAAFAALPVEADEKVKVTLKDMVKLWEISLSNMAVHQLDPAKTEVFIETLELIPAAAELSFEKQGDLWVGKFPKGEFAPEFPDECAILLVQEGKRAVRVEWKGN